MRLTYEQIENVLDDTMRECANVKAENARMREYVTKLEQANIVLSSDNTDLLCDMKDMQFFIAENAKLRDALRALMLGTVVELCDTRDAAACKECSMRRNNVDCAVTEAMELLGVDSHGEPMEAWKNE